MLAVSSSVADFTQTNPITLARFIMDHSIEDHSVKTSLAFILQAIGVGAKV